MTSSGIWWDPPRGAYFTWWWRGWDGGSRSSSVSAEVSIGVMMGRATVAVTILVMILVPTVVYAGTIAEVVQTLTAQGAKYTVAIFQHYLHLGALTGAIGQKRSAAERGGSGSHGAR